MNEPSSITIGGNVVISTRNQYEFKELLGWLDDMCPDYGANVYGLLDLEKLAEEAQDQGGTFTAKSLTHDCSELDRIAFVCRQIGFSYRLYRDNGIYNATIETWVPGPDDPHLVYCDNDEHPYLDRGKIKALLGILDNVSVNDPLERIIGAKIFIGKCLGTDLKIEPLNLTDMRVG